MSEFSQRLIQRSGYLGEGFADVYDRYRPSPPAEVLRVLTTVAGADSPGLVVDLGCGTGLATRAWAEHAREVIGVEPNPRMLERARIATPQSNVRFVEAYASDTGLAADCADLVTAWQAFHWMEPEPVLAEAERLLRSGGVFAACDYDVPVTVEPEVDAAFVELAEARTEARDRIGLQAGAASWPKNRHLDQIRSSGRFRYVRELVAHGWWDTDAERLIGLAHSIGGPEWLLEEAPEIGELFERACDVTRKVLGDQTWPLLLCYRIRVGVK